ncbi:hypothetical protein CDAR_276191 [Caerostris darwini]|uniref:Uncharacterized protein n=1 Tax=Caerostris darwini TaxID=1538125 RepID=A0AAV4PZ81_9ARAC|nr:hypothetical protein CDAR_276191 [Caerostris darwini]
MQQRINKTKEKKHGKFVANQEMLWEGTAPYQWLCVEFLFLIILNFSANQKCNEPLRKRRPKPVRNDVLKGVIRRLSLLTVTLLLVKGYWPNTCGLAISFLYLRCK